MNSRVALVFAFFALAISGCAKDARSLVPVDVSLLPSVAGVTKVVVTATADGKLVGTQTIDWTSERNAPFHGGVYVFSDVKGEVAIMAAGYSAVDELIAQAPAQKTTVRPGVRSVVIVLILEPVSDVPADGVMRGNRGMGGMPNVDAGSGGAGGLAMAGGSGGAMTGGSGGTPSMMRMWNPAVNVEKDPTSVSRAPMVAMDRKNGNAVIVWHEEGGFVKAMRYTESTAALSAPVTVDDQATVRDLRIGMDDTGRAIAVWSVRVDNPAKDGLWESHAADGLTWSKPVRLRESSRIFYSEPGIAFDVARNGRARAAWQESDNTNTLWTIYFDGTNWSAPAKVRDGSDSDERHPLVSLDAMGGGVLIWSQLSGASTGLQSVWASRFSGAALGAPALVETYEANSASYPHVNLNSAGKGAAVWIQSTGDREELWASLYDANGWKAPARVVAATWVKGPFVVSDNDANLTVAWSQPLSGDNGSNVMVSKRGAADVAWAALMPLETDNVAPGSIFQQPTPRLTVDPSGRVHAAWRKQGANDEQLVYVRDYTAAAGWGPQIKLGGVPLLTADSPQIATADNGLTLVTFYCYDPKRLGSTDAFNVFLAVYK